MFKTEFIPPLKLTASIFYILCIFTLLTCESKDTVEVIAIGEARNLPLGTEVTLMGRVTVASGSFASSTPYGYAIENNEAGIYIMDSTATAKAKYQMGQWVQVTGKLERVYGILMVREQQSEKQMPQILPMPIELISTVGISEETAGKIVQAKGAVDSVTNDLPYGYKIYMNDGSGQLLVFVNTSTGLLGDSTQWQAADSLLITGFSSQYEDLHELCPRTATDILIVNHMEK